MDPARFLSPVSLLYALSFLLLIGLSLFVAAKGSRKLAPLRRAYCLLSAALLLWQATLFLEVRTALPPLPLARANFAAVAFASYFALRFVQELDGTPGRKGVAVGLLAETALVAALAMLTPAVVAAERVEGGQAVTSFGPLFPAYLLHTAGYLLVAFARSLAERRRIADRQARGQLGLIAFGMAGTGLMTLFANAVLPYRFGDFRFSDAGALSTLLFVAAVAYATFLHGLFGLKVFLRAALVYGVLLAFVLGAYSAAVFFVAEYVTGGADRLSQFAVLLIAFSFDPFRRYLEKKTDRLLFHPVREAPHGRARPRRRD